MTPSDASLEARFRHELTLEEERLGSGPVLVAVSGGLDSVVLLHLLRFTTRLPKRDVHVAHVDHGLRTASTADAEWVSGLAKAWGLPVHAERVEVVGPSEESARNARYAALERIRRGVGASWVAVGHHADDQAETVLHRVARGTGVPGLAGMASFREPGIWRPLLPFWRAELNEYAARHGLTWRTDETNSDLDFTRNALRHVVLPELESRVAPGARKALVRLAELARDEGESWAAVVPILAERLGVERSAGRVTLVLSSLRALPLPLRARVLRGLSREVGAPLDRVGTRLAAEFSSSSLSGQEIRVTGGLSVRHELDRLVLDVGGDLEVDVPLVITDGRSGSGTVRLAGQTSKVEWGVVKGGEGDGPRFTVREPRYPLTVRARRAGDHIELSYGSKKLKKVFLEARVPEPKRGRFPVLVDADGRVLWIPGLAEATNRATSSEAAASLEIGIVDADTD
jgi:tRNA(Ile)-lysidine synthase